MTPEQALALIREKVEEKQKSSLDAMHSGCTDYACFCHFKIQPLRAALKLAVEALEGISSMPIEDDEWDGASKYRESQRLSDCALLACAEALKGER